MRPHRRTTRNYRRPRLELSEQPSPLSWTGAPCSQQGTWVEKDGRPGFPATWHSLTATCAAFGKESRMRSTTPPNSTGNPGKSCQRSCCVGKRVVQASILLRTVKALEKINFCPGTLWRTWGTRPEPRRWFGRSGLLGSFFNLIWARSAVGSTRRSTWPRTRLTSTLLCNLQ